MLQLFGFSKLCVVLGDLYFSDPNAERGSEGPERGVRLELRLLEQHDNDGSVYASRPIVIGEPLWRVDLLESVDHPGTLDRAHHHPKMSRWEPHRRKWEKEMTSDPLGWLERNLSDLPGLLGDIGYPEDLAALRAAVPEIVASAKRMLEGIASGELGQPPLGDQAAGELVRAGWL